MKDVVLRYNKNLFNYEKEEENYYKKVRVNNFWGNNYVEYKSGKSNKQLQLFFFQKMIMMKSV